MYDYLRFFFKLFTSNCFSNIESTKIKNKLQNKTSFKKISKNKKMKKMLNLTKEETIENKNELELTKNENLHDKIKIETSENNKPDKRNSKEGRLIIRNLSFKTTQESLNSYLQKIGRIRELNILKRSDGSLVGCAFVQYWHKRHAEIALETLNKQNFLGKFHLDFGLINQNVFFFLECYF